MEQLGCYGSLAPLPFPNASLGPLPCEREEKGKRKARPKSRDTYGSRAAQSGGPFFSSTPRTTNQRCHHHPGKERRAAAGSTGLALASGGGSGRAFAGGARGRRGPETGDLPRRPLSKAARTWRGGVARAHHGSHLGVAVGRAKDPREQLESEKRGVGGGPVLERVWE